MRECVGNTHVVESARILGDHIQRLPQRTERASIDTVTMRCSHDIRSGLMHRRMNHERRRIQQSALATINDLSLVVHLQEIGALDQGESDTERIHPEGRGIDRVTKCDVASHPLVEAELAKDAEGRCETTLEVFSFFIFVFEGGWRGEFGHLLCGLLLREAGLLRSHGIGLLAGLLVVAIGGCDWGSHDGFGVRH